MKKSLALLFLSVGMIILSARMSMAESQTTAMEVREANEEKPLPPETLQVVQVAPDQNASQTTSMVTKSASMMIAPLISVPTRPYLFYGVKSIEIKTVGGIAGKIQDNTSPIARGILKPAQNSVTQKASLVMGLVLQDQIGNFAPAVQSSNIVPIRSSRSRIVAEIKGNLTTTQSGAEHIYQGPVKITGRQTVIDNYGHQSVRSISTTGLFLFSDKDGLGPNLQFTLDPDVPTERQATSYYLNLNHN